MLGYGLSHGSRENQFLWFTALDPSIRPYLASSMLRAMTLSERIYRKITRVFEKVKKKMRETRKKNQSHSGSDLDRTHIYIYTCIPTTFYIYLDGKGIGDKYIPLGLGVAALTFFSLCCTITLLSLSFPFFIFFFSSFSFFFPFRLRVLPWCIKMCMNRKKRMRQLGRALKRLGCIGY